MNNKRPQRRQRISLTALLMILSVGIFSLFNIQIVKAQSVAPAFVDAGFNPVLGSANAQWLISRVQPDGKILAAGLVNVVDGENRNSLARFNPDGTLDATFNTGSGANQIIYGLDLQPDGKILVSGAFTNYNGVTVGRIARLNADGTLDATFLNGIGAGTNTGLAIRALVKQPDGKILVGGQFYSFNVSARTGIVRMTNATDTYGDFDGDSKADFRIQRRADTGVATADTQSIFITMLAASGAVSYERYGLMSDRTLPGDYDGDGKTDIGYFIPGATNAETGFWFISSETGAANFFQWGAPSGNDGAGDSPVVGYNNR